MKFTETDHVVYKAEHPECRRFPEFCDDRLKVGVNRNFQIFDPLDFIAACPAVALCEGGREPHKP